MVKASIVHVFLTVGSIRIQHQICLCHQEYPAFEPPHEQPFLSTHFYRLAMYRNIALPSQCQRQRWSKVHGLTVRFSIKTDFHNILRIRKHRYYPSLHDGMQCW